MNRVSTKVRVPDLAVMKERGERMVMLTAYDAAMARLAVVAYRQEVTFSGTNCVIVDPMDNSVMQTLRYELPADSLA